MQTSYRRHYSLENITNDQLYLCHFGWHYCEPDYLFGPTIRNFYLVHYVARGKGTFEVGGEKYEIKAGQSFIIYPGETTSYHADKDDPWVYFYFSFNGSAAPDILNMTNFKDGAKVIDVDGRPMIDIFRREINQMDSFPNKLLHGISVLMSVLDIYIQSVQEVNPSATKVPSYASKAKDLMDFNFSGKISVESMAEILSISRNHLYRTFKEEFDISPMEYLLQRRISFAATLLADTEMSAKEISEVAGFDTYSAFYRAFKIAHGISANQYRALAKQATASKKQSGHS
ncbi:MAG: AraC family transcriptional regulator [Clostridia bacterium]|nr:AraC family transcriptional regulator [Clostridia bacterium]